MDSKAYRARRLENLRESIAHSKEHKRALQTGAKRRARERARNAKRSKSGQAHAVACMQEDAPPPAPAPPSTAADPSAAQAKPLSTRRALTQAVEDLKAHGRSLLQSTVKNNWTSKRSRYAEAKADIQRRLGLISKRLPGLRQQCLVTPGRPDKHTIILDVCAGSGSISKAAKQLMRNRNRQRRLNAELYQIDIGDSPCLKQFPKAASSTSPGWHKMKLGGVKTKVYKELVAHLAQLRQKGHPVIVVCGTPCTPFSQTNTTPTGGIRDVLGGLDVAVAAFELADDIGTSHLVMENPGPSMLWPILEDEGIALYLLPVSMCQFGATYCKPTMLGFLSHHDYETARVRVGRRCPGPATCQAGHPLNHAHLTGVSDKHGSVQRAVYPPALGAALVAHLDSSARQGCLPMGQWLKAKWEDGEWYYGVVMGGMIDYNTHTRKRAMMPVVLWADDGTASFWNKWEVREYTRLLTREKVPEQWVASAHDHMESGGPEVGQVWDEHDEQFVRQFLCQGAKAGVMASSRLQ